MKKIVIKGNNINDVTDEIETLSKLKSRHVVNYYNYFQDRVNMFLVFELCNVDFFK